LFERGLLSRLGRFSLVLGDELSCVHRGNLVTANPYGLNYFTKVSGCKFMSFGLTVYVISVATSRAHQGIYHVPERK
jgi:hypothetical protein